MQHNDIGYLYDLTVHWLNVAKEDLETAKSNLKEGHYGAANNREYYIYHSTCAFLYSPTVMV